MTKKKVDKKKINLKLESGETYLVTSIDDMLLISKVLATSASGSKDKLDLLRLSEHVFKSVSENKFLGGISDEDEDWN